jgi:hypothetical protein
MGFPLCRPLPIFISFIRLLCHVGVCNIVFVNSTRSGRLYFAYCRLVRERLLSGNFAECLKLLQSYPVQEIDIHTILAKAIELQDENYQAPTPRPKPQAASTNPSGTPAVSASALLQKLTVSTSSRSNKPNPATATTSKIVKSSPEPTRIGESTSDVTGNNSGDDDNKPAVIVRGSFPKPPRPFDAEDEDELDILDDNDNEIDEQNNDGSKEHPLQQ